MNEFTLPIKATEVVLHREPMLLVDELIEYREDRIMGTAIISSSNLFLSPDGTLEPVACVELIAQLVAAAQGYASKLRGEPPKQGFLVGVTNFDIYDTDVQDGDTVTIVAERSTIIKPIAIWHGKVEHRTKCMAEGNVKIWESEHETAMELPGKQSAKKHDMRVPDEQFPRAMSSRTIMYTSIARNMGNFVIDRDLSMATSRLFFPADFQGFQGHFPEYSILPGIVMLQIALMISEMLCGQPLRLTHIDYAKFSQQVHPGYKLDMKVNQKTHGENSAFKTTGYANERLVMRCLLNTRAS